MKKKKPNLTLFIKTWPPHQKENKAIKDERPLTATLEKPQILDIRFIEKIDMSLVRKEFLCLTNLCRMPPAIPVLSLKLKAKDQRPLSLPSSQRSISSKLCKSSEKEEETKDKNSTPSKVNSKQIAPSALLSLKRQTMRRQEKNSDSNNNQKILTKIVRKRGGSVNNNNNDLIASTKLPEPCKTCGRPDQPERFHSHPATPLKPLKKMEETVKVPVKSTVQKPVAIKYTSRKNENKPIPLKKSTLPTQNVIHSSAQKGEAAKERPKTGKKARTLMCYLCGREFGTASLPLHEPRCLEKWERENATLPAGQRRSPPKKPDTPMTPEKWNSYAFETCQASLIPCENCGRTFLPDRLNVHRRSCKPNNEMIKPILKTTKNELEELSSRPISAGPLSSIECPVCLQKFGKRSITFHQPQCLKKKQQELENQKNKLPKQTNNVLNIKSPTNQQKRPFSSSKKPSMLPCYLCGRLFGITSIDIHEPQCLKKWKMENDKLPSNKRRPEPLKPKLKFTPEGDIDFAEINDMNWKTHLSQLIPCNICGRTFNPDRVDVHERSCKG